MRTTNFDAVAVSAPLDRQASTIRDGSGDLWEAKILPSQQHWSAPPPAVLSLPAGKEDLSGRVFGRMTVIRYHGRAGRGSRWLVRCSCGDYELRRTRVIKAQAGTDHCCAACDYLKHIRWLAKNEKRTPADDQAMLDRIAAGERP